MSAILDRIETFGGRFRPRSLSEFFALQLARKLHDDEANLGRYVNLIEHHSREHILRAFARARKWPYGPSLADRFEEEITKLSANP